MRTTPIAELVESPLALNVVFHVDGKLAANEFTGVRTGHFSKKDSHLMVQAAVPSGPVENRQAVLLSLLRDAVAEAETFAKKRGIAESLDEIRAIINQVAAE
ncbi:hypothetical protein [Agromyces badenianii]|nr:hypothetical protein [Agromyces badenianii]